MKIQYAYLYENTARNAGTLRNFLTCVLVDSQHKRNFHSIDSRSSVDSSCISEKETIPRIVPIMRRLKTTIDRQQIFLRALK